MCVVNWTGDRQCMLFLVEKGDKSKDSVYSKILIYNWLSSEETNKKYHVL